MWEDEDSVVTVTFGEFVSWQNYKPRLSMRKGWDMATLLF
jgi:hypothetical protein